MSAVSTTVKGAHLCGSIPLTSSDEVFQVVGEELGRYVKRIPDGETGERAGWTGWAAQVFWRVDGIEEKYPFYMEISPRTQGLADGYSAADIRYPNLEYADAALASYERFTRYKQDGKLARDVRFQVSLPTPAAILSPAVGVPDYAALEPGYEAAFMAELERILDGISHDELAIQWDVCLEVWFHEGLVESPFSPVLEGITERLKRYSAAVPDDVELGIHLCYGDYKHEHLAQPTDCRSCADIFNGASDAIERSIEWVHIPVPIERDDDAYFTPLDELRLPPETELYLGLVHFRDGVEGARRRIATAKRHAPSFGVATECGMGRRPPERGGAEDTLRELLRVHALVAEPVRGT
jgi:methionine synthase II (cobalamin-independent)